MIGYPPPRRVVACPNCGREFNPSGTTEGEYCPECWRAFTANNGTFERRTKPLSDIIAEQLSK